MKSSRLMYSILILLILILTGCNYGFFNFSSENGDLEIGFEFVNDNALAVDKLEYEAVYSDGSSGTFSSDVYGTHTHYRIDKMSVGSWTIKVRLITGKEVVQETEYSLDIEQDTEIQLQIYARWMGEAYEFDFQTWQNTDDGGNTGDDTSYTPPTPNFSITDFTLFSNYKRDYFKKTEVIGFENQISGSGFSGNVRSFELIYPDGTEYIVGEDHDFYGRALLFSHEIDAAGNWILINRTFELNSTSLPGIFEFSIEDYNGGSLKRDLNIDYDLSKLMPEIAGVDTSNILPESLMSGSTYSYKYSFPDDPSIGTRIAFIVDNSYTKNFYPQSDAIVVTSNSGSIDWNLGSGFYTFIVCTIDHVITTPVTDGGGYGTVDLNPDFFVDNIRTLYGADVGIISYTFAVFELKT